MTTTAPVLALPAEIATTSVRFYLGTHMPGWLALTDVPLFVSRNRLKNRHNGSVSRMLARHARRQKEARNG